MASANTGFITGVAGRYGRALFELIHEEGLSAKAFPQIQALKGAITPELSAFLSSVATGNEQKEAVLAHIAQEHKFIPLLGQFLRLVARKGRAEALAQILAATLWLEDQKNGTVHAKVLSATKLSAAQQKDIQAFVKKQASHAKDVVLETVVDKSLVAGLRVEVGAMAYDSSLKNRLEQMKTALKQQTSAAGK